MAADTVDIQLTYYKEEISPEANTSQSSLTKIEPFATAARLLLNSFAVLGYNVEILNVPGTTPVRIVDILHGGQGEKIQRKVIVGCI